MAEPEQHPPSLSKIRLLCGLLLGFLGTSLSTVFVEPAALDTQTELSDPARLLIGGGVGFAFLLVGLWVGR
jgi:hypothetical protein